MEVILYMCGIFGIISQETIDNDDLKVLGSHARQRGRDSSGLISFSDNKYEAKRADYDIKKLMSEVDLKKSNLVLGHSRLITNGFADNQPVVRGGVCVFHNGIIVNDAQIWGRIKSPRKLEIDSEVIAAIAEQYVEEFSTLKGVSSEIFDLCVGVISAAVLVPALGQLVVFSNNGSLYLAGKDGVKYFSSESYPLRELGCSNIKNIKNNEILIDVPSSESIELSDSKKRTKNIIPGFAINKNESSLLEYPQHSITRCTKCILPETMPFILFDMEGVCNYCHQYTPRNTPKPKEEIFKLVEPYRRNGDLDCIVPFSGGRDSCYGLHLVVKELRMKPITYTYDWGMVTDLGRRNISRMSAELGVENIIVAADIEKKRRNIAKNLKAWLKAPHLGMISILTAGDKHFFRYIEKVKQQTQISLNLWGVNPLEVTHFKSGFLGIPPAFEEKRVYMHG
ncbi:MAG: glucosamine 6-phosphate synthetase [Proteobacteria bacterium]|nr:glucosamine 6-phosphate synthetase [Pseudomonadota bacterium]